METTTGPGYPATYDLDAPEGVANWRPLVQWILAIPHLIVSGALGYLAGAVALVSAFTVLFTRSIPEGLFNLQVMVMRYRARVSAYAAFLHDRYPKFEFELVAADPGGDPVRLAVSRPETWNRWLPLVKWLLAVPHYVVLAVLGIASFVIGIVAFFAVLFTGRYPLGLRGFIVGVNRYATRVTAYVLLLRDEYPPFSLA